MVHGAGWDWRLRLKADLLVFEDGGESTLAECFARGERMLNGVELTTKRVATNIGMVHEDGHPEPWFIAMSDVPSTAKTFDYGLRWGIEAMFSDFKSRGFGLEDSIAARGAWKSERKGKTGHCHFQNRPSGVETGQCRAATLRRYRPCGSKRG